MKHLVLLGGGHAHLHVLRQFAVAAPAGAKVTLVSPYPALFYSGMVPAMVAGHCGVDDVRIALQPLAAAAGVRFVEQAAVGVDAGERCVRLADGDVLSYDALSIDVGGRIDRDTIPGARDLALFVRPMELFVRLSEDVVELAQRREIHIVVIGGGAGGFELATAWRHRLADKARVSLLTGGPPPLADYPRKVQERARRALRRRGITLFEQRCERVEADHVVLGHGARLACDAPIIATGNVGPAWLAQSGLALDDKGFVVTGATLQSTSHPQVFAAGDVSSRVDVHHARSGVYAVRAGPPLAENLRRFIAGGELQPWRPQKRSLNLLSCGDRHAIATWGRWSAEGKWVWMWKDRIDRGFVREASRPAR